MLFVAEGIYKEFIEEVNKASGENDTVFLPPVRNIPNEVARHTDIAMVNVAGTIVAAPELFPIIVSHIPTAIAGMKNPEAPYPSDIRYNAVTVGKIMFCSVKNTDKKVIESAENSGLKIVNVNQGYAKCSTIPISDSAMITSDPTIADAARKNGLDVLKVSNTGVKLNGFTYGFIGGTACLIPGSGKNGQNPLKPDNTGVFCAGTLIFTGDLDRYSPDADAIRLFCSKYNIDIKTCQGKPLYDFGSPLFYKYNRAK